MSATVSEWAWSRTDIGGSAKVVLLALAWWADDDGVTYQPVSAIAARAGLQERATQKALAELVAFGAIEADGNGGRGNWRKYTVKGAPIDLKGARNGENGAQACTDSEPERVHETVERVHETVERVHETVERVHTYAPTNVNPLETQVETQSKPSSRKRRVAELPDNFEDDMAERHPYWSRSKLQALIADALNYYVPQFQRGKYQDLGLCVQGSLRRKAEQEGRTDEPKPITTQQPERPITVEKRGPVWARLEAARAQAVDSLSGEPLEPVQISDARHRYAGG